MSNSNIISCQRLGKKFKLFCPNKRTRFRADTFFTKEPETIKWLDSFNPKDIFYDIGANVGLYSLFAAKRGIQTYSFEPESQNFSIFNYNIYLNDLSDYIHSFPIALNIENGISKLCIPKLEYGCSLNTIVEDRKKIACDFQQSVIHYSLDNFIKQFSCPFPTHIKIDVDGNELQIIEGAKNTISDSRLKSILIEIDENYDNSLIGKIQDIGFTLKSKISISQNSNYNNLYNCIFKK